jgi:hypothetical protein
VASLLSTNPHETTINAAAVFSAARLMRAMRPAFRYTLSVAFVRNTLRPSSYP